MRKHNLLEELPIESSKDSSHQQNNSVSKRKPKNRIVIAIVVTIACVIGIAMLLIEDSASRTDFGPMSTPEQTCTYYVQNNSDNTRVEFVSYTKSEEDTTGYEGGRIPPGWIGYRLRGYSKSAPGSTNTFVVYPCLYEKTSHEWRATMLLIPRHP